MASDVIYMNTRRITRNDYGTGHTKDNVKPVQKPVTNEEEIYEYPDDGPECETYNVTRNERGSTGTIYFTSFFYKLLLCGHLTSTRSCQ